VTDYAHVPSGPGTVLVSREANIYADRLDGALGLTYGRKQPVQGSFRDRVRQAIAAALTIASLVEMDADFAGKLSFRTDEIVLRLNDRLLAPNTPDTFAAVRDDLQAIANELYAGSTPTVEHRPAAAGLFEVSIRSTVSRSGRSCLVPRWGRHSCLPLNH
jgi:hypothetical protein